jgi:hypothetical protein
MIEAKGIPGLSQSMGADIASYKAAEDIAFGSPVYVAPGDESQCWKTPATGRVFAGVALITTMSGKYSADTALSGPTVNPATGMWNTPTLLAGKGDWVSTLKRGKVLVVASVAVQANARAYLTTTGTFGTAGTAIGYYRSNAAANELVDLEVSPFPGI